MLKAPLTVSTAALPAAGRTAGQALGEGEGVGGHAQDRHARRRHRRGAVRSRRRFQRAFRGTSPARSSCEPQWMVFSSVLGHVLASHERVVKCLWCFTVVCKKKNV